MYGKGRPDASVGHKHPEKRAKNMHIRKCPDAQQKCGISNSLIFVAWLTWKQIAGCNII